MTTGIIGGRGPVSHPGGLATLGEERGSLLRVSQLRCSLLTLVSPDHEEGYADAQGGEPTAKQEGQSVAFDQIFRGRGGIPRRGARALDCLCSNPD